MHGLCCRLPGAGCAATGVAAGKGDDRRPAVAAARVETGGGGGGARVLVCGGGAGGAGDQSLAYGSARGGLYAAGAACQRDVASGDSRAVGTCDAGTCGAANVMLFFPGCDISR